MKFRLVEDIDKSFLFEAEPEIETDDADISDQEDADNEQDNIDNEQNNTDNEQDTDGTEEDISPELAKIKEHYPEVYKTLDSFRDSDKEGPYAVFIEWLSNLIDSGLKDSYTEQLKYLIFHYDEDDIYDDDYDFGTIFQDKSLFDNNSNLNDFIYVVNAYKLLRDEDELSKYIEDFPEEYDDKDKTKYLLNGNSVKRASEVREMLEEWEKYQAEVDGETDISDDTDEVDDSGNPKPVDINIGDHTVGDILHSLSGYSIRQLTAMNDKGSITPNAIVSDALPTTEYSKLHDAKYDLQLAYLLSAAAKNNTLKDILSQRYKPPVLKHDNDSVQAFVKAVINYYIRKYGKF